MMWYRNDLQLAKRESLLVELTKRMDLIENGNTQLLSQKPLEHHPLIDMSHLAPVTHLDAEDPFHPSSAASGSSRADPLQLHTRNDHELVQLQQMLIDGRWMDGVVWCGVESRLMFGFGLIWFSAYRSRRTVGSTGLGDLQTKGDGHADLG